MPRVTTVDDALPFVAQENTLEYSEGKFIDWDNNGGNDTIPAGTTVCIIAASGLICDWATKPGAEAAYGILLASADKNDRSGNVGHAVLTGGIIFENMLTSYLDADWAAQKTSLDLVTRFVWRTYADDRLV